ncbi:MAG: SPFH domain-containing protein [bacterium]|jgi:hypothetical protein|nr:hypothetical protein [Planctomycetota bacterium]HIL51756.1 hypothetical protein [Planctomycetota bacterium]
MTQSTRRQLFFLRGMQSLAFLAAGALGLQSGLSSLSGESGLLTVGDDEVAVIHDNWSGAARQIDTPGKRFFMPFLQDARLLKRSPASMALQGAARQTPLVVPSLSIRAADGSSFRFENFSLQFALLPDAAEACLIDSSADLQAAAAVVEAHARAILRDEYGRFTTASVVQSASLKAADTACRSRLAEALAPHGLRLVQLSTPQPRFDPLHEQAVERRKVAMGEIERLRTKYLQLDAERSAALAAMEKDKAQELAQLEWSLGEYRAEAHKQSAARRAKAEQYSEARRTAGETRRFEERQEALALTQEYAVEAGALQRLVDQYALSGELAVRAAWIERLKDIPFRVAPYRPDPGRMELSSAAEHSSLAGL